MAKSLKHNTSLWFDELPDLLFEAVNSYDLTGDVAWSDLDALSSNTRVEDFEVDAYSSILEDGEMIAYGRIYVELQYGSGRDGSSFEDSYPARVFFSVSMNADDEKTVNIDKVKVDVSSFYE